MNQQFSSANKAKITILILGLLTLSLLGFLFFNLNRMNRNTEETKRTHDYFMDCHAAGALIRHGSDVMTNAVERYVITGNYVFRDLFFKEANMDRNRDKGLEKVKDLPNGLTVRRDLENAMRYSVELMGLEFHAMRLVISDKELTEPDCPPEVRDYILPEDEKSASLEERRKIAENIIFGLNYLTYKDHIYAAIDKSLDDAEKFLTDYRKSLTDQYKRLFFYQLKNFRTDMVLQFHFKVANYDIPV